MPVKRAMYLEPVLTNLPQLQTVQGSSYTKVEKGMKRKIGRNIAEAQSCSDAPTEQNQSFKLVWVTVPLRFGGHDFSERFSIGRA